MFSDGVASGKQDLERRVEVHPVGLLELGWGSGVPSPLPLSPSTRGERAELRGVAADQPPLSTQMSPAVVGRSPGALRSPSSLLLQGHRNPGPLFTTSMVSVPHSIGLEPMSFSRMLCALPRFPQWDAGPCVQLTLRGTWHKATHTRASADSGLRGRKAAPLLWN